MADEFNVIILNGLTRNLLWLILYEPTLQKLSYSNIFEIATFVYLDVSSLFIPSSSTIVPVIIRNSKHLKSYFVYSWRLSVA